MRNTTALFSRISRKERRSVSSRDCMMPRNFTHTGYIRSTGPRNKCRSARSELSNSRAPLKRRVSFLEHVKSGASIAGAAYLAHERDLFRRRKMLGFLFPLALMFEASVSPVLEILIPRDSFADIPSGIFVPNRYQNVVPPSFRRSDVLDLFRWRYRRFRFYGNGFHSFRNGTPLSRLVESRMKTSERGMVF